MAVTIARYETPEGNNINKKGKTHSDILRESQNQLAINAFPAFNSFYLSSSSCQISPKSKVWSKERIDD